jgi:hypothetical protein
MSQAQAAAAMDRLPWLADDPAPVQPPRKRSGKREFVGWAVVAVLLVAAMSYWMGSLSWRQHEALVAQDAGVVDQHVELAEGVDRLANHAVDCLGVGHVCRVERGLAARGPDRIDDLLARCRVGTCAVGRGAEVVHDDLRTMLREHERIGPADAPAGAGYDCDSSLTQFHCALSPYADRDGRR